ncbi:MAG: 4Fe-4S dicluster domain-containing protein [Bacteroidales bacterium]|nr:4Fe-4S dicluster domain-containing protein [Bacteroidales bacterium]
MDYFSRLKNDIRFIEGMHACINCGTCTAICPAAQYYEYDPRSVVDMVQRKSADDLEHLLSSDIIWYCGECLSCKTRCPRDNVPAYVIQALKKLSIESGLFIKSEKGRQQLAIVRTIGRHILEDGYCVHMDKIDTHLFPEQGTVWDWIKENMPLISEQIGANYNKTGAGALRKIPSESINELNSIFEITGGKNFFNHIEELSEKYATSLNMPFEKGKIDEYFSHIFNGESKE